MEAFIRKRKDFSKHMIEVYGFDVILASITDECSTITARYDEKVEQDDFIICGDYSGVVKGISVNGNSMTLTCSTVDYAFTRTSYYSYSISGDITSEELLSALLRLEYMQCDPMYAMPYLDIKSGTGMKLYKPSRNEYGLYTMTAYIQKLRKKGLNIQYDLTGDKLVISFARYPATQTGIDYVCHNMVTSETYGGCTVTEVTNFTDGVPTDYYLLNDGTVTHDSSDENRVYGAWEVSLSIPEPHAVLYKISRRLTSSRNFAVVRYSCNAVPCHSCIFCLKLRKTLNREMWMKFDEEKGGIVVLLQLTMKMKSAIFPIQGA